MRITHMYWNIISNTFSIAIAILDNIILIPISKRNFNVLLSRSRNCKMELIGDGLWVFTDLGCTSIIHSLN